MGCVLTAVCFAVAVLALALVLWMKLYPAETCMRRRTTHACYAIHAHKHLSRDIFEECKGMGWQRNAAIRIGVSLN